MFWKEQNEKLVKFHPDLQYRQRYTNLFIILSTPVFLYLCLTDDYPFSQLFSANTQRFFDNFKQVSDIYLQMSDSIGKSNNGS